LAILFNTNMSNKFTIYLSFLLILFVRIGSIQSQEPERIWRQCGESGDWFGSWIGNLGDINQDGFDDFAVSRLAINGRMEIFLGGNPPADTPRMIFSALSAEGAFISIIDKVGDINGDGWNDIAILYNYGSCDNYEGSILRLYYGGAKFDTIPDITLKGRVEGRFGWNSFGIGDVNHDGYDDIAVYAYEGEWSKSKPNIFFGGDPMDENPDWKLDSLPNGFDLGIYIVGNMDLNHDGIDDFAISGNPKPEDEEFQLAYFVFYGNTYLDSVPGLVIETNANTLISQTLTGDFNGDSYSDFVVFGGRNQEPSVYLGSEIMDTKSDLVLEKPTTNASDWGMWGKAVGDINKDGCDDIIAGFHERLGYMGQFLVYLGGKNMDGVPDFQWKSFMSSSSSGKDQTFCSDINGDGIDDIVFSDGQKKGCVEIRAGNKNLINKQRY
jgi:hypothetical protein